MNILPNFGPWERNPEDREENWSPEKKKALHDAMMNDPRVKKLMEETKGLIQKWDKTGLLDGIAGNVDKSHMANLCYSPPFPPMDENLKKLWDVLLSAGIVEVQMVEHEGKLGFMVYRTQTVKLEPGKFYPIESYGGETQQKAIYPYLPNA